MPKGAITEYIDVAQITLYFFWAFFALLVLYLRREDKREGYPLITERPRGERIEGFPLMPRPKTFRLNDGRVRHAPREEALPAVAGRKSAPWQGAPLLPTGNPMLDAVGPAAYANRDDVPDRAFEDGTPRLAPLRLAPGHTLSAKDADPRGMEVYGADRRRAGVVSDVWIDRSETLIRYLEVALPAVPPAYPRHVLLPVPMAQIDRRTRRVSVEAILAHQFAKVPGTKSPEQVTLLEEDKIMAYYGGGKMFATPGRAGPAL